MINTFVKILVKIYGPISAKNSIKYFYFSWIFLAQPEDSICGVNLNSDSINFLLLSASAFSVELWLLWLLSTMEFLLVNAFLNRYGTICEYEKLPPPKKHILCYADNNQVSKIGVKVGDFILKGRRLSLKLMSIFNPFLIFFPIYVLTLFLSTNKTT